jgi:hypothetical protein
MNCRACACVRAKVRACVRACACVAVCLWRRGKRIVPNAARLRARRRAISLANFAWTVTPPERAQEQDYARTDCLRTWRHSGAEGGVTCFSRSSASPFGVRCSPTCACARSHARMRMRVWRANTRGTRAHTSTRPRGILTAFAGINSTSTRPAAAAAGDGGATSTRSSSTRSALANSLRAPFACASASVRVGVRNAD